VLDLPAVAGGPTQVSPIRDAAIVPLAPHVLGVVQQAGKDLLACDALVGIEGTVDLVSLAIPAGRIIAVLFSEEITPESVQDRVAANNITNFSVDGNKVVGVALQPGRRVAFLALRDPIGPFVPRQPHHDERGGRPRSRDDYPDGTDRDDRHQRRVGRERSGARGRRRAGSVRQRPAADFESLRQPCRHQLEVGRRNRAASAGTGCRTSVRNRIAAVTPGSDEARSVDFTSQRNGQRLNVNVVFLGRGTLKGLTIAEDGTPLPNTTVKVTSLTDNSSYGATSDEAGQFAMARVPVGNVFIEGVNVAANAKGSASDLHPTVRRVRHAKPDAVQPHGAEDHGQVRQRDRARAAGRWQLAGAGRPGRRLLPERLAGWRPVPARLQRVRIGVARTDAAGRFELPHISAGQVRLETFDQLTFQQGGARVTLPADGAVDANLLLAQGLGTVNGTVLDRSGTPVADARVGAA